jgi:uncharacterized protein
MEITQEEIDGFFGDIKEMFTKKEIKKECDLKCNGCTLNACKTNSSVITPIEPTNTLNTKVKDKSGTQRTNVIYLNTDCNLRCEYCYEGNSRNGLPDQANCKPKDVDAFLNEIVSREKGCISTIVIMGGEPFLAFDMILYTMYKAASLTKIKGNGWGISVVSNGTLFTKEKLTRYKEAIDKVSKYHVNISQEVSYDGSGHWKRKWPDGSNSRPQVEKGIQKLIDFEIPFKISYVAHSGNYDSIVKDCIYILEKWPRPYPYRITVGWAYEELDKELGPNMAFKLKDEFRPYAIRLLDLYGTPICGNTCGYCTKCNQENFVGNSYLSPTTGISYDNKTTEHSFRQF